MKEASFCQRCYKKIQELAKENVLCNRCEDILEFGYPSFPSYRLEEYKTTIENEAKVVEQQKQYRVYSIK
jgi:hypothetical protein